MVFRRRSKGPSRDKPAGAAPDNGAEAGVEDVHGVADVDGGADTAEGAGPSGPWDIDDAPGSDMPRLDLGGLHIPTLPELELRLDTDPQGGVVSVLFISGTSALRIGAFAAPRRAGIWDDVRADLLETLRAEGKGEEREGPFGPELLGAIPGEKGKQTARFVGIDGPRWLLRGVFTGPAATNPEQAAVLERALREVVVARGGDALPVRDPLPLTLPQEILDQAGSAEDDVRQAPGAPERGPEITEIG